MSLPALTSVACVTLSVAPARISTCAVTTDYDTKLYVYAGSVTPGSPVACEDDTCSAGLGSPWVAELLFTGVPGSRDYWLAVDAWSSTDVGTYELNIRGPTLVPCTTDCLPTDIINPGVCGLGIDGDDGCFEPGGLDGAFFPVEPGNVYCGTYFTEMGARDHDWYEITLPWRSDLTIDAVSENGQSIIEVCDPVEEVPGGFEAMLFDAADGCGASIESMTPLATALAHSGCISQNITLTGLEAGTYWYVIRPGEIEPDFVRWDCPNKQDYRITIFADCAPYLRGDVTGDQVVDFDDLNLILANWAAATTDGDTNDDGTVNFEDLNLVLDQWGGSCED